MRFLMKSDPIKTRRPSYNSGRPLEKNGRPSKLGGRPFRKWETSKKSEGPSEKKWETFQNRWEIFQKIGNLQEKSGRPSEKNGRAPRKTLRKDGNFKNNILIDLFIFSIVKELFSKNFYRFIRSFFFNQNFELVSNLLSYQQL